MAVGIVDVVIDFLDQFLHAAKRSPTKSLLRDAIEPDFHLIEPGGIGWSEVYVEPWPRGEPASNSQMLVCGVIIQDDVHFQVLRHVLLNLPEKAQILLMPVVRSTFREHFASTLVVDDLTPVVTALLRESFDVVGMVSDGQAALESTLKLSPDLL